MCGWTASILIRRVVGNRIGLAIVPEPVARRSDPQAAHHSATKSGLSVPHPVRAEARIAVSAAKSRKYLEISPRPKGGIFDLHQCRINSEAYLLNRSYEVGIGLRHPVLLMCSCERFRACKRTLERFAPLF